ncbi:hypothetical protein KKB28_00690, partial [bacterium]|nr:hypothetical protein [bacterium]
LSQTLTIRLAPGKQFSYQMLNSDKAPNVTQDKGESVYTWHFDNSPQIMNEPDRISTADIAPRLLWTSFSDWKALGEYVGTRFWSRVDTATVADAALAELVPNKPSKQENYIENLCIAVQRQIRNVDLQLGRAGYEPNTADNVWAHRYGETRDKAVLLTALLKQIGVSSFPVLVMNQNVEFIDLPVLEQFRHIILGIPRATDTLYVDPMAQDCRFGTLPFADTYGRSLALTPGNSTLIDVPHGDMESRTTITYIDTKLHLDGTLEGTVKASPKGQCERRCRDRLKDMKEKEMDIYFQGAASQISQGATVIHYEMSDLKDLTLPAEVIMAFKAERYANRQGDVILFDLTANPFEWALHGFFPQLPQVRYPIELPAQGKVQTILRLQIPQGVTVGFLPEPVLVDNPYYQLSMTAHVKGEQIIWEIATEIKADKVPVADYNIVREGFQNIGLEKNRLAIFELIR